ncbi:hypothetical protein, partial [Enterobacter intestinihominis]
FFLVGFFIFLKESRLTGYQPRTPRVRWVVVLVEVFSVWVVGGVFRVEARGAFFSQKTTGGA